MCDYITDKIFYIYAIYFDKFGLPQFLARPAIVWPHIYKNIKMTPPSEYL